VSGECQEARHSSHAGILSAHLIDPLGRISDEQNVPTGAFVASPSLSRMLTREDVAAFGFVERLRIGENHRSQLSFGDGAVIAGDVRHDRRPPRQGEETHAVMVRVDDARAHCERARAHGAGTSLPRSGAGRPRTPPARDMGEERQRVT
jgi:hypothetical protein